MVNSKHFVITREFIRSMIGGFMNAFLIMVMIQERVSLLL